MKAKVIWKVLGAIIVVGGVACFVKKYLLDNTDRGEEKTKETPDNNEIRSGDHTEVCKTEKTISDEKSNVVENISDRHEVAKELMKEAVSDIFSDTQSEAEKNDDILKKISDDLDNLKI